MYCRRRSGDLYGGGNILLKAKNVFKGLQGVENVYTQHVPLLAETLRLLASNDLNAAAYPYAASSQVSQLQEQRHAPAAWNFSMPHLFFVLTTLTAGHDSC